MGNLNRNDVKNLFSLISKGEKDKTSLLNRAKEYMIKYPNDDLSKEIRNWVFNNIKVAFLNPKLRRAFEIPDEYFFTKKIEIYRYLPFISKDDNFAYYFGMLFGFKHKDINTPKKLYLELKKFCDKYYKGYIPKDLFEKIFKYMEKYDMDFYAAKERHVVSYDDPDFMGVFGEYSVKNWLEGYIGRTTYLPNVGCGSFGSDILYDDPIHDKEFLVEVKTTLQPFHEENILSISNNEEKAKNMTAKLPKTEYVLIRVYINSLTNEVTFLTLYWDKEKQVFYNNDNPLYRIEYKKRKKIKNLSVIKKSNKIYSKTLILKEKAFEKIKTK